MALRQSFRTQRRDCLPAGQRVLMSQVFLLIGTDWCLWAEHPDQHSEQTSLAIVYLKRWQFCCKPYILLIIFPCHAWRSSHGVPAILLPSMSWYALLTTLVRAWRLQGDFFALNSSTATVDFAFHHLSLTFCSLIHVALQGHATTWSVWNHWHLSYTSYPAVQSMGDEMYMGIYILQFRWHTPS